MEFLLSLRLAASLTLCLLFCPSLCRSDVSMRESITSDRCGTVPGGDLLLRAEIVHETTQGDPSSFEQAEPGHGC